MADINNAAQQPGPSYSRIAADFGKRAQEKRRSFLRFIAWGSEREIVLRRFVLRSFVFRAPARGRVAQRLAAIR